MGGGGLAWPLAWGATLGISKQGVMLDAKRLLFDSCEGGITWAGYHSCLQAMQEVPNYPDSLPLSLVSRMSGSMLIVKTFFVDLAHLKNAPAEMMCGGGGGTPLYTLNKAMRMNGHWVGPHPSQRHSTE